MKHIALDSVLLFALVIPFVMTHQLSPGETPYFLFGLIFLGIFFYILLDVMYLSQRLYDRLKQILLWTLIIGVIGSASVATIIVRHQTASVYGVHDIVVQQEAAIRFLLYGKNPYAETYFGTQLEQWHYSDKEVNPALYHFVMEPFYILFALPFYVVSNTLFGFFDGRMPLLFLLLATLAMGASLIKDNKTRLLFLILLAFNPAMLPYIVEGRSDIFMFAFLFAGFYLLYRKQYSLSGISVALAFAIKQSAWPILPFYIAFLYFKTASMKKTIKLLLPFLITFAIIVLPFLLWNSKAFLDSTIFYLSGNNPNSYPISGYGLGKLLNQMGFIKDVHEYYPFHIWQFIVGLPLLYILMRFLKKSLSVRSLIIAYGLFLFVYWYLSRYFNNSHLGYLSLVFITAYFWPEDDAS